MCQIHVYLLVGSLPAEYCKPTIAKQYFCLFCKQEKMWKIIGANMSLYNTIDQWESVSCKNEWLHRKIDNLNREN